MRNWPLWAATLLLLVFAVIVGVYEQWSLKRAEWQTRQYGHFLGAPLDRGDRVGGAAVIELVFRSNEYRAIEVLQADGAVFAAKTSDYGYNRLDRVLAALGLVGDRSVEVSIVHAGRVIGQLKGTWINRNVYVYTYVLVFLALLFKLVHYYASSQRQLERRVEERTTELQEANEKLAREMVERERTEHELIHMERLGALGEMASGIAHDFNNRLSMVLGYSDMLLMDPDSLDNKEYVTECLQIIRTSSEDAAEVVRRLRAFYRYRDEDEAFEAVDLNRLVDEVERLTQPKWAGQAQASGRTIRLEKALEAVPPVNGNESELREVLTNLVFNAVDAMPEGGTLTLGTRAEGERAVLSVGDTGTGMDEETRQRCMEPFFTTKGEGGTGLGLGLVFGIVRRHEGEIDLESAPGQGTTFSVSLPVRSEPEAVAVDAAADGPLARSLRILCVDDDERILEVIRGYLVIDGHEVVTAGDGATALVEFNKGRFDAVISDQAMPDMSGIQLAAAVEKAAPGKPFILLSGFGEMGDDGGIGLINCALTKPITVTQLRQALRQVMDGAGR